MSFTVADFNRRRQSLDHATYYAEVRKTWTGILSGSSKSGLIRADVNPVDRSDDAALYVRRLGRARRDRPFATQCQAPARHHRSLFRKADSLICTVAMPVLGRLSL